MARGITFTPRRFLSKIVQIGAFDLSPDGRRLAYSANKRGQWTVYVRDMETKRERILLESSESVVNPEFSPDGRSIAVQSDFEGDENFDVYVAPSTGGPARNLTRNAVDDAFPRWSPDGRRIAFLSNRDRDRDNVFVVVVAGGEPVQLTDLDDVVGEIAWRPDGQTVAFTAGIGDGDWIGLVDMEGRVERLVSFPNSEHALAGDLGRPHPWSPDGRELAFVSNLHDHLDLGVIDVASRTVRWLARNRWDKTMPIWSPDGRRLAFLENHDGDVRLKTIDRDGAGSRPVSPPEGVASRPRWHPDGRGLFYLYSNASRPEDLIFQRSTRRDRLVVGFAGTLRSNELAKARLVRYPTFDGRTIPAWLFLPPRRRFRHAALVDPHGGPESQTLNEWDIGTQFLVAQGYAVLRPNYRGGSGYGRAWRRLSDKDLGGADMKDIVAAGRWLVRRKICPPDRLGIIGVSYGGYAVAHCLEQAPDLWAVGVSVVGFFNWFTATTTERGYLQVYDRWKMGHPDTDAALFRRLSPIFYLDRILAPILFTGGAHDPRCPVTEARQIVDEMKHEGKIVDYLEFPDEGHWPRKMANQILLYARAISWLDRFLPDRGSRVRVTRPPRRSK